MGGGGGGEGVVFLAVDPSQFLDKKWQEKPPQNLLKPQIQKLVHQKGLSKEDPF